MVPSIRSHARRVSAERPARFLRTSGHA